MKYVKSSKVLLYTTIILVILLFYYATKGLILGEIYIPGNRVKKIEGTINTGIPLLFACLVLYSFCLILISIYYSKIRLGSVIILLFSMIGMIFSSFMFKDSIRTYHNPQKQKEKALLANSLNQTLTEQKNLLKYYNKDTGQSEIFYRNLNLTPKYSLNSKGIKHGVWELVDSSGLLIVKGNFVNGFKHGDENWYRPTGESYRVLSYNTGVKIKCQCIEYINHKIHYSPCDSLVDCE